MKVNRIKRFLNKPLSEKLNFFLYNYRAFKLRYLLKFKKPKFLIAKLEWGEMKTAADWLGMNIYFGSYERKEMLMVSKISKPNWVALDIGANIGYYTVFLEKKINCARVHAFEPSPREYQLLKENVEKNNCKNIITHNIALGDQESTIKLYTSSENIGKNSINYFDSSDQSVTVYMKVLNEFISQLGITQIDFIKIDVEGAEPMVLKGAAETLKKFKPVILYESWALTQAPYGSFECETTRILENYGYRIFDFDERGRLINIEPGDQINSENALAIHKDRIEAFQNLIKI